VFGGQWIVNSGIGQIWPPPGRSLSLQSPIKVWVGYGEGMDQKVACADCYCLSVSSSADRDEDRVKVTRVWGRSAQFMSFGLDWGADVASFEATLSDNVLKFGSPPQIFRINGSSMQGHYRVNVTEGEITLRKIQ
jgi:hypothetical protein